METAAEKEAAPSWLQTIVIGRNPRVTLVRMLITVLVCFLASKFVLLPIRVEGVSMLPTYKDHSVNVINRWAYLFHEPRRGDVIAVRFTGEHAMLLKRIVGMPGETVAFRHGQLFINEQPQPEPYLTRPYTWDKEPVLDGPGQYYVVGDNRSMEPAEHTQGLAERKRIIGKTVL